MQAGWRRSVVTIVVGVIIIAGVRRQLCELWATHGHNRHLCFDHFCHDRRFATVFATHKPVEKKLACELVRCMPTRPWQMAMKMRLRPRDGGLVSSQVVDVVDAITLIQTHWPSSEGPEETHMARSEVRHHQNHTARRRPRDRVW